MSELFFIDQETFEKAFYDPGFQAGSRKTSSALSTPVSGLAPVAKTYLGRSEVHPSK